MANTRAATVQKSNRLVRRAELDTFNGDMSKLIMSAAKTTLQFFKIESTGGNLYMPEPADVK